jgi:hypothetical protein
MAVLFFLSSGKYLKKGIKAFKILCWLQTCKYIIDKIAPKIIIQKVFEAQLRQGPKLLSFGRAVFDMVEISIKSQFIDALFDLFQ